MQREPIKEKKAKQKLPTDMRHDRSGAITVPTTPYASTIDHRPPTPPLQHIPRLSTHECPPLQALSLSTPPPLSLATSHYHSLLSLPHHLRKAQMPVLPDSP